MATDEELAAEKVGPTWGVGPTEDVVQALMESLVDPLLPLRVSNVPPSEDAQKSVAKQMHAVVLLYNYHHRKQKKNLTFLDFTKFCNLALVLKPPLIAFMKLMTQNEPTDIDAHNHLSITEKAIKDACDVSIALDASRDYPDTKEWPISKVSVLLIDSNKENCMLRFGAVTEGVWSLIEKEVEEFNINSEISADEKVSNKRKRNNQKGSIYDAEFVQIGYDAVKDVAGIDRSNLEVLETHVTYSSSKENSAALFYMMQYNGSFGVKVQVPLKFLVESLQGPLAEKLAYGLWKTTPVVEYHNMLPYVEFISSWLSRKDLSNSSTAQSTMNNRMDVDQVDHSCGMKKVKSADNISQENCDGINKKSKFSSDKKVTNPVNIFHGTSKDGNLTDKFDKPHNILDSAKNGSNGILANLANNVTGLSERVAKDDNATEKIKKVCDDVHSAKKADKDNDESHKGLLSDLVETRTNDEDTSKKPSSKLRVYYHRRKNNSSAQKNDANVRKHAVDLKVDTVDLLKSDDPRCRDEKLFGDKGDVAISCNQNGIATRVEAKTEYNVEVTGSEDLQNALALLCRKRQELYHQICIMEDSLALYEDNIARIREDGEVGLARECIKSIISGDLNLLLEHGKDDRKSQLEKQTTLSSETYLLGKSSCQDLEYVCLKNNWRLPRYIIEPSNGKFTSDVFVEAKSFKLSMKGGFESKPCEARESAAAKMIAKIHKSC